MADPFTDIAQQHAEAVAEGRACSRCASVKGWLIIEVERLRDLLTFAANRIVALELKK
jgi:hypothetical protein